MFSIAVIAEILAFATWGITANIQETWIFDEISPFYFIVIRFTVTTIVWFPFIKWIEGREIIATFKKNSKDIIILGLINFVQSCCYQIGVTLASGFSGAIWIACQPAITLLLATYTGRERTNYYKSLGIFVVMTGIFSQSYFTYITFNSQSSNNVLQKTSFEFLLGQFSFFCYTVVFSFYAFNTKYMTNELGFHQFAITFWGYLAAIPFVWAAWGTEIALNLPYDFSMSKWAVWGCVIALFFGTFLAYSLFNFGNHYIESSLSVALGAVAPFSSRAFSAIIVRTTNAPHWGLHDVCWGDCTLILVLIGLTVLFLDGQKRFVEVKDVAEKQPLLGNGGGDEENAQEAKTK